MSTKIVPVSEENEQEWALMWAEISRELWDDTDACAEDFLVERSNGNYPHEFLYNENNEAVAFISLSLRRDYVEGTDSSPVGYLEGIFVKPAFRSRGIAKELFLFAKKWAISQGCTELASDCELDNEISKLFHMQLGFKEANCIICYTMDLT